MTTKCPGCRKSDTVRSGQSIVAEQTSYGSYRGYSRTDGGVHVTHSGSSTVQSSLAGEFSQYIHVTKRPKRYERLIPFYENNKRSIYIFYIAVIIALFIMSSTSSFQEWLLFPMIFVLWFPIRVITYKIMKKYYLNGRFTWVSEAEYPEKVAEADAWNTRLTNASWCQRCALRFDSKGIF